MNEMISTMMNMLMMSTMGGMMKPIMAQSSSSVHTQEEGDFTEVIRIPLSTKTDLTVSEVVKHGVVVGYSLSKYVRTAGYTGYSKGIMIPIDKAAEFHRKFGDIIVR